MPVNKKNRAKNKSEEKLLEKEDIHRIARRLFSNKGGDEFLLHLCAKYGVTTWKPNAQDEPLQVNLGERRVIFDILGMAGVEPSLIMKAIQQQIKRQKYDQINNR